MAGTDPTPRAAMAASQGSQPRVSVVIACRNEAVHIEQCLRSILRQQPPDGGFEVIVADGMSDDGTREVLARLTQELPAPASQVRGLGPQAFGSSPDASGREPELRA